MKIAFLTSRDPQDKLSWSGIYYYMAQALQKHCGSVTFLGPVDQDLLPLKIFNKCSRILFNKRYDYYHSTQLAKKYSKIFSKKLSNESFNYIFAPAASTEIAYLDTDIPIISSSDTTFSLNQEYYPEFSNLLNISSKEGNIIEGLGINKSSYLIYPSQWASKSAVNDYKCDSSKVHVIPYGANLDHVPPLEVILKRKNNSVCRLLFLGVDWKRKGGEIAFETLIELQKSGIPSELIICGCVPPKEFTHKNMTVIPFLNKNDPAQSHQLEELLLTSSFLLLPTRQECYGIVFCEASAYGLPSITTKTGGIPVKNDINGYQLSTDARGASYAELIRNIFTDIDIYQKLVISSKAEFDNSLNWDTWGKSVNRILTTGARTL